MDKKSAVNIIYRLKDIIENKKITVSRIILFGSFAKGNGNEDSDIDIVIISDDFASMTYWERIDCLSDAIYEVFEPIEAVSFTNKEWNNGDSFLVDYAKEGEVVYAA